MSRPPAHWTKLVVNPVNLEIEIRVRLYKEVIRPSLKSG